MKIVTDILVHTNMTYYDIEKAGPTCLKILDLNHDLVNENDKDKRNIQYGIFLKNKHLEQYIPWLLKTFSKFLCFELNGILYTMDSIVTNRNITSSVLNNITNFNIRPKWKASLLVIHPDKKSYFAKTNKGIIIKGDELSPKMLDILTKHLISKNWIFTFKKWFLQTKNVSNFVTNKNRIKLYDNWIDVKNVLYFQHLSNKIDKHFYWKKLLPYFQAIQIFL